MKVFIKFYISPGKVNLVRRKMQDNGPACCIAHPDINCRQLAHGLRDNFVGYKRGVLAGVWGWITVHPFMEVCELEQVLLQGGRACMPTSTGLRISLRGSWGRTDSVVCPAQAVRRAHTTKWQGYNSMSALHVSLRGCHSTVSTSTDGLGWGYWMIGWSPNSGSASVLLLCYQ